MISNQRRAAWLGAAAVLGLTALNLSVRPVHAQETPAPAPPAPRQGGGAARGNRQGGMRQNPAMAAFAATKPTADQQAKFDALNMAMRTEMQAARQGGNAPDPAKMQTMQTKFRDDVKALLTDDQKKTFDTEMAKAPAMGGFVGPGAGGPGGGAGGPGGGRGQAGGGIMAQLDSLALTPDEKTKIEPLIADTQKQLMALPRADRQAKTPELMTTLKASIRPLLTAEQQTKLDALTLRAPRGGGGRRGGAGGPGAGGPGGQGGPGAGGPGVGAPPPPPAP